MSGQMDYDKNNENLIQQLLQLQERVDQLERYALTSQTVKASNVVVGTPSSPLTGDGDLTVADDLRVEGEAEIDSLEVGSPTGTASTGQIRSKNDIYSESDVIAAAGMLADGGMIRSEGGAAVSGYGGDGIEMALIGGPEGRLLAYTRPSGPDIPLRLRGSAIYLDEAGSIVCRIDGGDFYTQAFADYSGSSSTTGWSSFTEKEIYYKTIGDLVFVTFNLQGTSNSATTNFTVPYYSKNSTNYRTQFICRGENSGVWSHYPAMCSLPPNSNQVACYLTNQAGTFSASGGKSVIGQFFYQRA